MGVQEINLHPENAVKNAGGGRIEHLKQTKPKENQEGQTEVQANMSKSSLSS